MLTFKKSEIIQIHFHFFYRKNCEDADGGSFTIRFPMGILWNIQDFIKIIIKNTKSTFVGMNIFQHFEDKIV